MSNVPKDRNSRRQQIQEGLQFIQSTLPYNGTQEQYEVFLRDLVRNLFDEGNDVYKDDDWNGALTQYTEALGVADYAKSEEISISSVMIEKLHANRAACYLNMGRHDKVIEDCNEALQLNSNNCRALYRKSKSLKELGRHKEAYDAVAKCSLAVPQDDNIIKLTQELAQMLGLKIRKAYVRAQPALNTVTAVHSSSSATNKPSSNSSSIEDIESDLVIDEREEAIAVVSSVETFECVTESIPVPVSSDSMPTSLTPEKVPMPSTVLVNGGGVPYSVPETRLDYVDGDIIGDDLDELLDSVATDVPQMAPGTPRGAIPSNLPVSVSSTIALPNHLLASLPTSNVFAPPAVNLPSVYSLPLPSLDTFTSTMDSLDTLPMTESQRELPSTVLGVGAQNLSRSSPFILQNSTSSHFSSIHSNKGAIGQNGSDYAKCLEMGSAALPMSASALGRNPLSDTHEFKQACPLCFVKSGPNLLDYTYHPDLDHKCKKEVLVGRKKNSEDHLWKRIRPRPTKTQYMGPYYICKDVAAGEECKYMGHCTFAYCQEEIDVWTLERKGAFSRELLFDPCGGNGKINLTVAKLLQEHHGIFMYLCQECFDHKPRIISKRNKDNPTFCSHPDTRHFFEENKCLVHILRETTVKYSKIRPLRDLCQFDLCRHEVRYGCIREDECFYAHSLIELKVWMMQLETGISHDAITQESKKYWQNMEASVHGGQIPGSLLNYGTPNLKMKFVCGQCWRNGQVIEPDKNRKYCSAKARHQWTKERRVVLVMSNERKKWTTIRPLPTKKPVPLQFDLCNHISSGKKCQYIGNCSFAHSQEEKEMWTYMKDNSIQDMEQLYEIWLTSQKTERGDDIATQVPRDIEKQIHMPTDYADITTEFHCWLCGKNCNSEKQWQQHITSEKHKEKVFHSEDDQNCWQHRFPTGCFTICEGYLKNTCTKGENCQLAHGEAELKEWHDRRDFLGKKLAKARNDHLIAPDDLDFGKYSFLIKELN
ncbi:zinc finger CCCH domain-containing protein 7A isoform X2 [Latimeria chalumnae]|uniref:zinc finger CCCH domain-containing protein 7A isoform X2 n=2 Tax=Latimeria chalumnae TaxID=7897 RepID=UPI00313F30DF